VTGERAAAEAVWFVQGPVNPDALTGSLQALFPSRRRVIARRRFTVLDTFDGRVRRAGARLTQSGADSAPTIAWRPAGGRDPLAERLRQPVSFAWDLPAGRLRQALAPVIGVRRLLAQADAERSGIELEILDDRGKAVARLEIEACQARLSGKRRAWQPLPTSVTLTGLRGYEDAWRRLVPVIESRPGITSCPGGLHGLILRELDAPEREYTTSPRVHLPRTVRADVGARHIHRALVSILESNELGVRHNVDTEFLHDFRVAVRRTRSLLGQIKHVFVSGAVEHFSTEFSWLGRLTGPPRDLDVLVLALRAQAGDMPASDVETLVDMVGEAQQEAHRTLVAALNDDRYQRLLSEWKTFLDRPAEPAADNSERFLLEVIADRAWQVSRRIARCAEAVDEHSTPEQLHAIRIDAKKLRYLIDVTPEFYDAGDLESVLGALKGVQRVLGDFNDAEVQEKLLLGCTRRMSVANGSGRASLTLGRLAERICQRRERLREAAIEKLTDFCDHRTRSACRHAFKRAGCHEEAR